MYHRCLVYVIKFVCEAGSQDTDGMHGHQFADKHNAGDGSQVHDERPSARPLSWCQTHVLVQAGHACVMALSRSCG